jgi:acetate---CoA ligase (ADP-forming)
MSIADLRAVTGREAELGVLRDARSVAVLGASATRFTPSWRPIDLLRRTGFAGEIYPINPKRNEIEGITCYPDISAVPRPVDLALIALGADRAVDALHACADAGAKLVIVVAQGFSEQGQEGRARERILAAAARERGIGLIGPNTDGAACLASGVVASIQPVLGEGIPIGPIAVVAQSGATAASLLQRLKHEQLGCRYSISTGNEADLGLADYLSFVVQDPAVELVLGFIETIRRPEAFRKAAALAAELGKPIAVIKAGASAQAARRTIAHTGALAGHDQAYDALLRADGVIRVAEPSELVAVAKLYLRCGAPRSAGVGVVSVSGGGASLVTDKAVALGLDVPETSPGAEAELNAALRFGGGFNPCDLTGEIATKPELAGIAYSIFSREPSLATIVYARKHLTGTAGERAAESLAEVARTPGALPLAVYGMDGVVERAEEAAVYAQAGIPTFTSMQDLFTAVARLSGYAQFQQRRSAAPAATSAEKPGPWSEDPWEVLRGCGIDPPRQELAGDAQAAVRIAAEIGYPVVLKLVSDEVAHRSEIGAVATDLRGGDDVTRAYARIWDNARAHLGHEPSGAILVQEQVEGGVELIAGVNVDPQLGPFVLAGIGGVHAEVLQDAALRPAPVDRAGALAMLGELKGAALLHGVRGAPAADVEAAADAISALSRFAAAHADKLEAIDINPLIALPRGRGVRAVDALVVRRSSQPGA